jgi:hypothetical protein
MQYEDQKEADLLKLLADSDDESSKDKDFNDRCLEGTCKWFLTHDTFRSWRAKPTSSILWVSAGAGCGKSVLTRSLIDERLLTNKVTTSSVCYFFFRNGVKDRMGSASALRAILHQLFLNDSSRELIKYGVKKHHEHQDSLKRSFSLLWKLLMDCAEAPESGEIVCVLDALDECDEGREELIKELELLYSDRTRQ